MLEKTYDQREFSHRARRLLLRRGKRSAFNQTEFRSDTLRITSVWTINHKTTTLSVWHNAMLVHEETNYEMNRWAPRSALAAAYDDMRRLMVLEDLADV